MKAVICSIDGIPDHVAVLDTDEEAKTLRTELRLSGVFDRIDIITVMPTLELVRFAREEGAKLG